MGSLSRIIRRSALCRESRWTSRLPPTSHPRLPILRFTISLGTLDFFRSPRPLSRRCGNQGTGRCCIRWSGLRSERIRRRRETVPQWDVASGIPTNSSSCFSANTADSGNREVELRPRYSHMSSLCSGEHWWKHERCLLHYDSTIPTNDRCNP